MEDETVDDGAQVLPSNGGADGLSGRGVPHHRGGALIGNANCVDATDGAEGSAGGLENGVSNQAGVDLDHARLGTRGKNGDLADVADVAVTSDDA